MPNRTNTRRQAAVAPPQQPAPAIQHQPAVEPIENPILNVAHQQAIAAAPLPVHLIQPLRVKEKDPPIFQGENGEDVVEWLASYEQIVEYNMWTDDQALRNLGMALGGVARRWFVSLLPRPETFQTLRTELLDAFKPQNYEMEIESQLRSRTQKDGESAVNYCYDMIYLCNKLDPNMPESFKVQHIIRGLNPSLVIKVYPFLSLPYDSKDLLKQIQIQCQASQLAGRNSLHQTQIPHYHVQPTTSTALPIAQPIPTLLTPSPTSNQEIQNVSTFKTEFLAEIKGLRKDFQDEMAKERDFFMSVIKQVTQRPYYANQSSSGSGPDRNRNKRTRNGDPICNSCQKVGHIARYCPSREKATGANAELLAVEPAPPKPSTSKDPLN